MTDVHSPATRSRNMAAIHGKDTKPEVWIRKKLFAMGFRYRLHQRGLAGKPDLVLKRYRAVIFVNGCFWHKHNCHLFKLPGTRAEFWLQKLSANAERHKRNTDQLLSEGWRVLTVWECAMKGRTRLSEDQLLSQIQEWITGDTLQADITGHSDP